VRRPFKTSGEEEVVSSSRWVDDYSSSESLEEAEEEEEEDESYEVKWRRRRVEGLKSAPQLSAFELNDLFEADYMQKKAYEQEPNREYGVVVKFEGGAAALEVVPTFAAAWAEVAAEFECEPPSLDSVEYAVSNALRNEVAVESVFGWTDDWGAARDMSRRYNDLLAQKLEALEVEPRPGIEPWLASLEAEGVPCALVSKLPKRLLLDYLDKLGLAAFFEDRLVAADDERESADQAFLHAAVALERQPKRCIVFTDALPDLLGAHEAEMRAVGLIGPHPAYELQVADLVIDTLDDFKIANIRSIFADVEFDEETELELEPLPETQPTALALEDDYDTDEEEDYD